MVAATLKQLDARRAHLGMTKRALARRAGLSEPTVHRILSGREDHPSLATIQAIAAAMGARVDLTLAFDTSDLDFQRQQARQKAGQIAGLVQGTMALESQAVGQATLDEIVDRAEMELVTGSPRRLWDE